MGKTIAALLCLKDTILGRKVIVLIQDTAEPKDQDPAEKKP